MTIKEANDKMLAVLAVLNTLAEAVGDIGVVLRISISRYGVEVLLNEPSMQAAVKALPNIEASMAPMGDDYPGRSRWTMCIDGVTIFTIVREEAG